MVNCTEDVLAVNKILVFVAVHVLICGSMVQGTSSANTSVWWDQFSACLVSCSGSVAQFQCKRTVGSRQQRVKLLVRQLSLPAIARRNRDFRILDTVWHFSFVLNVRTDICTITKRAWFFLFVCFQRTPCKWGFWFWVLT